MILTSRSNLVLNIRLEYEPWGRILAMSSAPHLLARFLFPHSASYTQLPIITRSLQIISGDDVILRRWK